MRLNPCKRVNQSDFVPRLYTLQHETHGARSGRQSNSTACPPIQRRGGGGSRNGAGLQDNMDSYSHKISQKGPCQNSPKKPAIVRPYYLPCNAFWSHGRTSLGYGRKNGLKALTGVKEIMSRAKGKEVLCIEVLSVGNLSGGTRSTSPPAHRIDEDGRHELCLWKGAVVECEQGNMD